MVKREVHKNLILLIVAIAQFMVVLDVSIVNVALPSIYRGLHFTSQANLQWVVTAYTLAFGGFLLLGGRAADLFGRKRLFIISVLAFAAASALTGSSQSSTMIEITRAVQGLMGAFMSPAALSIILVTFRGAKERAKALSVWGAVAAGGAAAGVLLGGVLTQYLSWRWDFFVNVPVGIAVALAAWAFVPESKADLDHKKLDVPGAVLVTAGLMLLVYAFTKAPSWGWGSAHSLEYFAASAVLLIAFLINEARSKHALMPLDIFKVGSIASANATMLPVACCIFSMFFFVTLYVQLVLKFDPVRAGLGFLPVTLVIGGTSVMMQHVIPRIGYKKPLMVAPVLLGAGIFWLAHFPVNGTYLGNVLPGLLIIAVGMGMNFIGITFAATAGVPHHQSGLASGLLVTAQQVGGSLGLAVLSGVSASTVSHYLKQHAATAAQPLTQATAQVNGFNHGLLVGVGFAAAATLISVIFIREQPGVDLESDAAIAA